MKNKPATKRNNNGNRRDKKPGRPTSVKLSEAGGSKTASPDADKLTSADKVTLQQLETAIGLGLSSFVEVGHALSQIKESRLYRETATTFENYCSTRWHMSRQHAYKLMKAAACYDLLKRELSKRTALPLHESQLRPIVGGLKRDQWVKAWKQVVAGVGPAAPTAEEVVKVVNATLGRTAAKRGEVQKKLRRSMPNKAVAKVVRFIREALGDKKATVDRLRDVLERIQNDLKSLA